MTTKTRTILPALLLIAAALAVAAMLFIGQPQMGAIPSGARLDVITRSPHYQGGEFQNLEPTPVLTGDSSTLSIILSGWLNPAKDLTPTTPLIAVKTDLHRLDHHADLVIWLGHSSYYVQLAGKRILIDPVFSDNAAPLPYANEAFAGSNPYSAGDFPDIDYLLITHDHWDHLDYPTLKALLPRVKAVVSGLGVGAHLERFGYPQARIHEADWNSTLQLDPELTIHLLPARHYSGRLFKKNQTLWVAFALKSARQTLFFSSDSGYGRHFADIGRRLGPIDLAVLDMGQYDPRWPLIHMTPEEAAKAAEDLQARALMPAHLGKFALANHPWMAPLDRISLASDGKPYRLLTPRIGQPLAMASLPDTTAWWQQEFAQNVTLSLNGQDNMRIKMTINGRTAVATLDDTPSARDFFSQLPLTLALEEYAQTEKIAYLPRKLTTQAAPEGIDPQVGDIAYYAPWGNLAIYYRDFGYSSGLIRLGRLASGLDALTAQPSGTLTIEAVK